MRIHILAINNIGVGLSGGDSIWINLAKRWDNTLVWGSRQALETYGQGGMEVCDYTPKSVFSKWGIFTNTIVKLFKGTWFIMRYRDQFNEGDIVYSVSDFFPDFIPALLIKLTRPHVKWVAGFFLFISYPFPQYRHDLCRGIGYWLMQRISYPLIKKYADVVFVTSDIDKDKFPNTVVVKGGV
ncbi:MAG: hypothetical protein KKC77_19700 [Proteobacteria bacterium]|nr:hypothetical protein [Pseudomonadota bacterium]